MTAKKMHRLRSSEHSPSPKSANQQRRTTAAMRQRKKSRSIVPPAGNALKFRLVVIWLVFCGGILGLFSRFLYLQIFAYEKLHGIAREQQSVTLRPYIPRRTIIDRHGNALAVDEIVYSLYVHPIIFRQLSKFPENTPEAVKKDPYKYVAYRLASVLPDKKDAAALEQLFRTKETGILLTHDLGTDVAQVVRDLNLDGVELVNRFSRFYPQKEVAAETLGFVDFDHYGQTGVEFYHKNLIEREPIVLQLTRSGNGSLLPTNLEAGLLKYDDWQLQLTLDLTLQRVAREALKKQLAAFNAKRGAVVVMDVHSGEILTLATEPTYDPNIYYSYSAEEQGSLFKNWVVSDLYEPGSTFKPINVAIALDKGVITPETVVYDSGRIMVDTWPIANHDYAQRGGNGSIDVAKVLQVSSNVGMVQLMAKIKREDYYDKLVQLQMNKQTGIDLPGEGAGYIKDRETFMAGRIEAATNAFGQGFSLTPLKLLQLHAALANGGLLVRPHVVRGLVDSKGEWHHVEGETEVSNPPAPIRLFSAKAAQQVVDMMETVVTDGSGKASEIPGYRIGGKTSTAQKAENGIYIPGAKITSFVAIFPVDKPKYAILAIVDEPKAPNSFGGTVAAPIAKEVLEVLIAKEAIAPTGKKTAPTPTETIPTFRD
jgi:cell division protein FtsI (penicillin-binding protein 3)